MTTPAGLHSRIKVRQLALLVALAEQGSLRKAAERMAMSQPAATKLLQEIEATLDARLFERQPWGVEPTLCGQAIIRYARGVLTDLEQARDEIAALSSGAKGRLRVGGVTGSVPHLLVPAVAAVRRSRPALQVFLLVNAAEMLVAALRQGTLDAAVAPRPPADDLHDLRCEPLAPDPLCVVGPAGHALARRTVIPGVTLASFTWIVQPPGTVLRQAVDALFAAEVEHVPRPEQLVETVSIVATLALLASEQALSVLPMRLARHYEEHRLLTRFALRLPAVASGYALITRKGRDPSPATIAFGQAVRRIATMRPRRSHS